MPQNIERISPPLGGVNRSINELFIQSARHDFELGLTRLSFDDGQFEIFANQDYIAQTNNLNLDLGSTLNDSGTVELATGETSGYSKHVTQDMEFLPDSLWVTDDVPTLPSNAYVEYEIEDENGNTVTITRDQIDSSVDVSGQIETFSVSATARLKRDTTSDSTPVLDAFSVYMGGEVPREYLDATVDSVDGT